MRAILTALLLTIASQAGSAVWDPNNFDLKKLTSIKVVLEDGASGACWTNLKEVREYAEEKLRMKGVKINNDVTTSEEDYTYSFTITVNSERINNDGTGPCYGDVNAELYTFGFVNGSVHVIGAGKYDSIAFNSKNLNQTIIEVVRRFISEFK
ncbi:hypothetical protein N9C56_10495 [Paracoccaceae bacterium]|nr:hypothetical protein [Paracoccaceae bacterium]